MAYDILLNCVISAAAAAAAADAGLCGLHRLSAVMYYAMSTAICHLVL